jgi:hypothetical protein
MLETRPEQLRRRRDGRVAEGARLESVFRGNSNVGSNPTLSAITFPIIRRIFILSKNLLGSMAIQSSASGLTDG